MTHDDDDVPAFERVHSAQIGPMLALGTPDLVVAGSDGVRRVPSPDGLLITFNDGPSYLLATAQATEVLGDALAAVGQLRVFIGLRDVLRKTGMSDVEISAMFTMVGRAIDERATSERPPGTRVGEPQIGEATMKWMEPLADDEEVIGDAPSGD